MSLYGSCVGLLKNLHDELKIIIVNDGCFLWKNGYSQKFGKGGSGKGGGGIILLFSLETEQPQNRDAVKFWKLIKLATLSAPNKI